MDKLHFNTVALALVAVSSVASAQSARPLPLAFEENLDQDHGAAVEYLARGPDYGIALGRGGARLRFAHPAAAIAVALDRAGARAAPTAEQPLPGRVNYLVGSDPRRWRTDLATYGRVRYAGVYPGIDLVYHGNQGRLEYDFVAAPGADPARIGVRFEGAGTPSVDAHGNLRLDAGGHEVVFQRPVAYQMDGERQLPVAASYRLDGGTVRFRLGRYDRTRPLVIDPILRYLSYLGGSNADWVGDPFQGDEQTHIQPTQSAAVDGAGNLYVVGTTFSTNFPAAGGIAAPAKNGSATAGTQPWVFVTKVAPDGSTLVYSTYIGGSLYDLGNAIAVDSQGDAYITGWTNSADFPATAGAFQTKCGPFDNAAGTICGAINGRGSAFVAKLNPAGNGLVYSTFLGSMDTVGYAVAVDAAGRAHVAGSVQPTACPYHPVSCFPTTAGAVLADLNFGDAQAFVSVLDPAGSALVYSTLYGDPTDNDPPVSHSFALSGAEAVAIDPGGNFYVGGFTTAGNLPTTSGALQRTTAPLTAQGISAWQRGFVAKFSPVGGSSPPALIYGTYLGGAGEVNSGPTGGNTQVSGLVADASGDVYAYGYTTDNGFPTTAGAYQTACANASCGNAGFIAELDPTGGALVASTLFGSRTAGLGDGVTMSGPIVRDAAGNVYITGQAQPQLPQVNPIQSTANGVSVAFAAAFDATLGHLLFSTMIGDSAAGSSFGAGIAVDGSGNLYIAGNTGGGAVLATTAGVFQPAYGGTNQCCSGDVGDGFVAKIDLQLAPPPEPDFSVSLSPTSGSTASGGSVTTVVSVGAQGGFTGTVSFACSGLPAHSTCSFAPATVTPAGAGAATTTLTVETGTGATSLALLPLPLLSVGARRRRRWLAIAAALLLAACSGGGAGSTAVTTPAGSYTVTVTATSGSISHSTNYTLTVN